MRSELRRSVVVGLALAAVAAGLAAGLTSLWYAWELSLPTIHTIRSPEIAEVSHALASSGKPASLDFAFPDQPHEVPDLRFVDGAGQGHSLAEFRGHPIVLNIWATWCVPCRKEMPTLDRLQGTLAGTDALVLALSIDSKGPPAVKSFYREIGIKSLGIYVDATGSASRQLGAVGIPVTLLIDRDGREIGRKIGAAEWDSPEVVKLIRSRLGPRSVAPASEKRG